jgi:hypothetical protein
MAITGRFEADFQSFYQAVDRANAKLTTFSLAPVASKRR